MDLVEETAAYLDGAGRTEAKALERSVSLTYATESMRLTTRLMQLASWLLLHRAVKEGEMTLTQANREKTKVKLTAADPGPERHDRKAAAAIAGSDRPLDGLQARCAGSTPRIHAPVGRTRPDRQSAGAAAQPPEGGVRAAALVTGEKQVIASQRAALRADPQWLGIGAAQPKQKTPRASRGVFDFSAAGEGSESLSPS